MSSLGPPDGVTILAGEWGTHLDREEAIVLTGNASLAFLSTASGSADPKVGLAPVLVDRGISTYVYYDISWAAYATSVTAGNTLTVEVDAYATDGTFVSTTSLYNAVLSGANAWKVMTNTIGFDVGDDVAYLVPTFKKKLGTFALYLDNVDVRRTPAYFTATGTYTVTTGGWKDVNWGSPVTVADWQDLGSPPTAVKNYFAGISMMTAWAYPTTNVADAATVGIAIYDATSAAYVAVSSRREGGSNAPDLNVSSVIRMTSQHEYRLRIYNNTGGSIDFTGVWTGAMIR